MVQVNEWCWEVADAADELERLRTRKLRAGMAPADCDRVYAELKALMRKAEHGRIRFVSTLARQRSAPDHDADVVGAAQCALELRPSGASALRRPTYVIRLYYCEPVILPDGLLALHVGSKRNDASGKDEQNESIRIAEDRADRYAESA